MVHVDNKLGGRELTSSAAVDEWIRALAPAEDAREGRELIQRAYELAARAHASQTRASGDPYIRHAMAVADILAGLRLDHEAIAAAILHDVVEDTEITVEEIAEEFGPGVARLVDGVTKMRLIDHQAGIGERGKKERLRAESLRKLLLAMAEDVRVVLIKLADRLHNMRTLGHLSDGKQRRIARETLDIYAPLANRLGIWQIKWELEDLAFRYLEPATYKRIAAFLDERRVDREQFIATVVSTLETALAESGVRADVAGRPKHIYSIWRKMQRKGLSFHQLYDVRAVRLMVDEVADCYAALGVVHTLWRHIPREFDDYIATPKENNYQSIHTAVVGPQGKTLEVQIRTRKMHEHAELGVAAHWKYKEGARHHDHAFEQKIAWLRQLLEWRDESSDAGDFIDRFKSEVFEDRVYVLTPQGDVFDLPQGATPLDFAYYVHTEVGHRCRGAKVDGRIVPLTYELKSGEQVEILTTKHGTPSRDWLNPHLGYLKTSRARAKARHWFRQQDLEKSIAAGRTALERELHRLGITDQNYEQLAGKLGFRKVEEVLTAIGRGEITASQIAGATQGLARPPKAEATLVPSAPRARTGKDDVYIQGVGNLLTRMAKCCKPAPGDPIIGFITLGQGVTVHRRDCPNILKMNEGKRSRLIEVEWATRRDGATYPVDLEVEAVDRQGLLRDISALLSNEKVNVTALTTRTNQSTHMARMDLTLELRDVDQLSRVLGRIGQLPNVVEVRRRVH